MSGRAFDAWPRADQPAGSASAIHRINAATLRDAGVTLELGGHHEQTFLQQDLIIPSPGVPMDAPLLQAARARGVAPDDSGSEQECDANDPTRHAIGARNHLDASSASGTTRILPLSSTLPTDSGRI
jgi:hypothetical protein